MSDAAAFWSELGSVVPGVSTDPGDREAVAADRSGAPRAGIPDAVVRARSVDDVRATLRLAHRDGVAVVPRGAGTGLAGGATAGSGTVVLDLSGLDRIRDLDPVDQVAVVEPGVLTADLDRAAAAHGLRYAPDPASAAISTIGGNIATNAGGLRCVKYGVTRDAVLGVDVVLADGTLIGTGRRTLKGVAGLDLTGLFVGSEGTLGVVVGATVQLRPLPHRTLTTAAAYADVDTAARACAAVAGAQGRPAMLELLDPATLAVIDRAQGSDLSRRGGALVILQTDGPAAEAEMDDLADILGKEATWLERATDAASSERLVEARRLALPSIERFGRAFIEDICVPRSRLAEAFAGVAEISARHEVDVYCFAHAGDGNLHPIISHPDGPSAELPPDVVAAADEVFALAIALGGTITGEHGIGTLKRRWLARELGEETLSVQARIKQALDPHGILNPGKGF